MAGSYAQPAQEILTRRASSRSGETWSGPSLASTSSTTKTPSTGRLFDEILNGLEIGVVLFTVDEALVGGHGNVA